LKSCAIPHEALWEENLLKPEPVIERRIDPEGACVVQDADGLGERAVDVEPSGVSGKKGSGTSPTEMGWLTGAAPDVAWRRYHDATRRG
jgi:hypothetical protein